MTLNTTAQIINLAKSLEEDSAAFYRVLAENYPRTKDTVLTFISENKGFSSQIERVYYGVITDALEGCFSFNIEPALYILGIKYGRDTSFTDGLKMAIAMENKIIGFYKEAVRQSESLMADIPKVFKMVAFKRGERIAKLMALLSDQEDVK